MVVDVQHVVNRSLVFVLVLVVLAGCGSAASTSQPNAAASSVATTAAQITTDTTTPSAPTSPSSSVVSSPASAAPMREADEMEIVAAAAVARLTKDNSFGPSVVFDRVNIVDRFGAENSEGLPIVGPDSAAIGPDVRAAVEQALSPMSVTWVASLSEVIGTGQEIPTYEEVGPVLALSSPNVSGDHATITTGLWCGGLCGAGGSYTLEWTASQGWLVTGTEGMQWVS